MSAMVMLDVDGVLADMSAFEYLVATESKKWRKFFRHGQDAALIPAGAQLAVTLKRLGFDLVYSSTRPFWCNVMTREWIRSQQLPKGYVYVRDDIEQTGTPAAQVKLRHFTTAARNNTDAALVAFIDDETAAVEHLRAAGVPAWTLTDLRDATDQQLLLLATATGVADRQRSPQA